MKLKKHLMHSHAWICSGTKDMTHIVPFRKVYPHEKRVLFLLHPSCRNSLVNRMEHSGIGEAIRKLPISFPLLQHCTLAFWCFVVYYLTLLRGHLYGVGFCLLILIMSLFHNLPCDLFGGAARGLRRNTLDASKPHFLSISIDDLESL